MTATPIPTKSRKLVRERDEGRCQRCSGPGTQWHHRRRRGVQAGHDPHCPCIGISLCDTCHRRVHAFPHMAVQTGFIVSASDVEPWEAPVKSYHGWRIQNCDGTFTYVAEPKEEETA